MFNKNYIIKAIIILFIVIFCFNILSAFELNIFNTIKLNFPENISFNKFSGIIYNTSNEKVVLTYGLIKYDKINNIELRLYFKVNDNLDENYIKKYTELIDVNHSYAFFGMGDIYKIFINDYKNTSAIINKNNINIRKYISFWGSQISSDILIYNFKLNHPVFNECLIEFINIWQTTGTKTPKNLKTPIVNKMIAENDKRAYFYKILDNVIKYMEIFPFKNNNEKNNISNLIEEKKEEKIKIRNSYFTPIIDNLELRDLPFITDSKVIRLLKKGEKLMLADHGNEEVINGKKGYWLFVETENVEWGWCFNAYLKDITDEMKYLTPNINVLRLRESPSLNGKYIRTLDKGEILILLKTGKEATIDGIKGNWVKVRTEKGEEGWCFSGYLKEVEY